MNPELEKCHPVMLRYAQLYAAEYREKWLPTSEHITSTVELFKSPMPGFEPYTPEDLIARLEEFFKVKEPWLVNCKHNYAVFIKHIHRWIPRPLVRPIPLAPVVTSSTGCYQHGIALGPGELCPKCFPPCTKCGEQHAAEDDCAEYAERMKHIKTMFSDSPQRSGKTKQLGDLL
jgi:hypothetical protein